ncbi:unnamed protein product, partial [Mesorhabditis spiculigera]
MFAVQFCKWWHSRALAIQPTTSHSLVNEALLEAMEDPATLQLYFDSAAAFLPSKTPEIDEKSLLHLYGLYKMATCGAPGAEDQPAFYDLRSRRKFDAWREMEGLEREQAMKQYVLKLDGLEIGWDPREKVVKQTFGKVPSRMAIEGQPDTVDSIESDEALWFLACKHDDLETAQRLFHNNPALLNEAAPGSGNGLTALHWAVDSNSKKTAIWLLDNGANMNAQDDDGNSPLHYAATNGHHTLLAELLGRGADRASMNVDGEIPQDCADDDTTSALFLANN